jgi:hypothetical protein
MKKIAAYAEQVLNENYRSFCSKWYEQNPDSEPYIISEWCELELQSDYNFFRWLFNDVEIEDFGSNLTEEEMQIATTFFESL